ncbi:MAG: anti-sigma factor [Alphaproteobacteria bacterium]
MSFMHHDGQVREEDLQAYVDGLLEINLRATVEAYLALHPEEAERVTAYRAQNVALHQAYDIMTKRPLPASMERMLDKLSSPDRGGPFRRFMRRSAMAAGLVLAVASGWIAHEQWPGLVQQVMSRDDPFSAFTRRAVEAHAMLAGDLPPPLVEKGPAAGNALVGWLSQRASSSIRSAPNLRSFELQLAGGRIFFIREQLVLQLIYRGKQGQVSLYVGASPRDNSRTTFTFAQQGDLSTFYWRQGKFEFSLVSGMPREQLLDVAKVVQNQLGEPVSGSDGSGGDVHPLSSGDSGSGLRSNAGEMKIGVPIER